MTAASQDYEKWIGRTETVEDDLSPANAQAAAATFDLEAGKFGAGVELPYLWHWFYFLPKAPQSKLGGDGHPHRATGSFMPPIPLPRRMFAGARLTWHLPMLIGRPARREAVISKVIEKSGRSGNLAFVTVAYRYFQQPAEGAGSPAMVRETENAGLGRDEHADSLGYRLCLEEEQDIVYREPGAALPPPVPAELPDLPDGAWSRTVVPDTRLLFRFSALTFNAHRIHYDRPYATTEEGYPGLVVHGPLTAMLLLQLVRTNTAKGVASFSFRSQAPLFDLAPFRLVGLPSNASVELRAEGPDAKPAMLATAEFQP